MKSITARIAQSCLSVTLLMLGTQMAGAVNLICIPSNPSSRDWVPKAVFVSINPQDMRAALYDEFTEQTYDGPLAVDLSRPTKNRVQMNWKLVGLKDRRGRSQNVTFKMTLDLKRNAFTYAGKGESYFITPGSAQGKCVAAKAEEK